MIWFTSDTHFLHEKVVELSNRPYQNYADMEESLINNWNSVVKRGDVVYHLGDFAISWGKASSGIKIDRLIRSLNGSKFLIVGNHDRDEVTKNSHWTKVTHYHEIKVDMGSEHKKRIVMCHYPMKSWNQMHRGSWMLHGHCHGNLQHERGLILDVGVDCHSFTPISIDDVGAKMSRMTIETCDHYT